jgi:hypothetical protein
MDVGSMKVLVNRSLILHLIFAVQLDVRLQYQALKPEEHHKRARELHSPDLQSNFTYRGDSFLRAIIWA